MGGAEATGADHRLDAVLREVVLQGARFDEHYRTDGQRVRAVGVASEGEGRGADRGSGARWAMAAEHPGQAQSRGRDAHGASQAKPGHGVAAPGTAPGHDRLRRWGPGYR